jgi:hypothetical protein
MMVSLGPSVSQLLDSTKLAGHREVAPREFDVHSRWLTIYQMSTPPANYCESNALREVKEKSRKTRYYIVSKSGERKLMNGFI